MPQEFTLFTPANFGIGVSLSCSGSSSRAAFPEPKLGSVWAINNTGLDNVSLLFDDGTRDATTACMVFEPGTTYLGIPNAGSQGAPTHVAGITTGATVVVQITNGDQETG